MIEWQLLGMAALKIVFAVGGGLAVYAIVYRLLSMAKYRIHTSVRSAAKQPLRAIFVLLALMWVLPGMTELSPSLISLLQHAIGLGMIGLVTWLATIMVDVAAVMIVSRQDLTCADNFAARRINTRVMVLERTIVTIIVVLGAAAALMTFPRVREIGTTLLVSAGFAGIVVGLAARPVLENLIAGLQLALTQPISLDDVVVVEGESGRIEEITSTYVVIRIWDDRRLIVPFAHFISRPFQNWTRRSAAILSTVFIHADYTLPVQALRDELLRICESTDLWDHRVCNLQVTDAGEQTLQLRALISAANSTQAGDLVVCVRERLVEFLQREHPGCLPRSRIDVVDYRGTKPPLPQPDAHAKAQPF
ncbi:MAG: mechanosensitive ion channel family protein [Porticoccaceae bacterium]